MWWGARKAEMCTRSVGSDAMAKSKHLLKFTRKLKPLRREHRHHEMGFAALEARSRTNGRTCTSNTMLTQKSTNTKELVSFFWFR